MSKAISSLCINCPNQFDQFDFDQWNCVDVCHLSVFCVEISGFKYLSVFADNKTPEELPETLVSKMKLVLSSGSDEECAVCLESLTLPVITRCAHVFCKPCIFEVIRSEQVGDLWLQLISNSY